MYGNKTWLKWENVSVPGLQALLAIRNVPTKVCSENRMTGGWLPDALNYTTVMGLWLSRARARFIMPLDLTPLLPLPLYSPYLNVFLLSISFCLSSFSPFLFSSRFSKFSSIHLSCYLLFLLHFFYCGLRSASGIVTLLRNWSEYFVKRIYVRIVVIRHRIKRILKQNF